MSNRKKEAVSEIAVQQLQQQLEALRNVSKEAFDFIANFYMSHLKAMAGTVLKSEQDAEDTVQEALIRAYKSLESFRGESRISTWLCRIVLNRPKTGCRISIIKMLSCLKICWIKSCWKNFCRRCPANMKQ